MIKEIVLVLAMVALAFAAGRYSDQNDTNVKKVTQTEVKVDEKKETHVQTQTTTTKLPTGVVTTVTTTDTVITDRKDTDTQVKNQVETISVQQKHSKINVSALVGIDFRDRSPVYGVAISKEFIGPVTIGAFGLINGIVGVSIGLNF